MPSTYIRPPDSETDKTHSKPQSFFRGGVFSLSFVSRKEALLGQTRHFVSLVPGLRFLFIGFCNLLNVHAEIA